MKKFGIVIVCFTLLLILGCKDYKEASKCEFAVTSFFLEENSFILNADVTTQDIIAYERGEIEESHRTERAELEVCKVADCQNGSIFKLMIPVIKNKSEYLNEERLNIYFYIMADRIYRIWSYIYQDENLIEFYDDDDLLLKILDTEEKIINNSYIVYQSTEIINEQPADGAGINHIIEDDNDQIISRRWIVKSNGETDYYETFVWDKLKGFSEYNSGFRALVEPLKLTKIEKT